MCSHACAGMRTQRQAKSQEKRNKKGRVFEFVPSRFQLVQHFFLSSMCSTSPLGQCHFSDVHVLACSEADVMLAMNLRRGRAVLIAICEAALAK